MLCRLGARPRAAAAAAADVRRRAAERARAGASSCGVIRTATGHAARLSLLAGIALPPRLLLVEGAGSGSGPTHRKSLPPDRGDRGHLVGRAAAVRTAAEQAALVAALRQEFGAREPPPDASGWPEQLLRSWFEDEGTVTVRALSQLAEGAASRQLIDEVGAGFPVVDLPPLDLAGEVHCPPSR